MEIIEHGTIFSGANQPLLSSCAFWALSKLSERERYVFFNRALDERSLEELAGDLGMSYKGVAAIYYRTVQKIRRNMKGESL